MKDGKPVHNIYNTDAAWGAQWNLSQLWIMAYPEYISDYISSHLQAYEDAGWLADGLANNRYVSGVGTNLLPTIIAGAYECGIRDFDTKLAYEACLKNELDGENRPFGAGKSIQRSLFNMVMCHMQMKEKDIMRLSCSLLLIHWSILIVPGL